MNESRDDARVEAGTLDLVASPHAPIGEQAIH